MTSFGTLKADTLTHSTAGSLATNFVVNGSAKAWVNFDGSASNAAARDSFNLSSMTDSGTGDHEMNVSSALVNNDFSSTSSCRGDSSNDNRSICTLNSSTTNVNVNTFISDDGSAGDVAENHVTIHGDLA